MAEAVIVDAVRTPVGKRYGALSGLHPAQLLGLTQKGLLEHAGVDPAAVAQVVGGCVTQAGEQSNNVTRNAWLYAGLPYRTACTTIDCACGSSQQAVHLIAGLIASGAIDAGIGCGVEAMSRVFLGQALAPGTGSPAPDGWEIDYPDQFTAAERIAKKRGITRADADALGVASQAKARRAWDEDRFAGQIVEIEAPVMTKEGPTGETAVVSRDQGLRDTTAEALAKLNPVIPDGVHTAGNSSQISDGAVALLVCSGEKAHALGIKPLGRLVSSAWSGCDPARMGLGPVKASAMALRQAGWKLDDVDMVELNEAFAAQSLAVLKCFKDPSSAHCAGLDEPLGELDDSRLNAQGGAIALGHPVGATGARLVLTALMQLQRNHQKRALVTLCIGGGQGGAVCLEAF